MATANRTVTGRPLALSRRLGPGATVPSVAVTAAATGSSAAVAARTSAQLARSRTGTAAAGSLSSASSTAAAAMAATVPRVVAPAATLVAPVIRMEPAGLAARWASPAPVPVTAAAQTPATLAGGQFYAGPTATDGPAVQPPDRVLGIAGVLELDEGKTGRVPGHPDIPQRTVIREGVLDFLLAGVVAQLPDVNLGIMRVARHLLRHFVVPTRVLKRFFHLLAESEMTAP